MNTDSCTKVLRHLSVRTALLVVVVAALPPSAVLAQDEGRGASVYDSACAACHGGNGRGGQSGPSVLARVAAEDDAALAAFLRTGSPERGMPPAAVTAEQMPLLLEHLRFLAESGEGMADVAASATPQSTVTRTIERYQPIDDHMLLNPDPADWLWFSRTADAQRFSPLDAINTGNVSTLALAWSRGLATGLSYAIPLVHDGVMYLATPDGGVIALDATNGDQMWQYHHAYADPAQRTQGRSKTLAMYADMVYFTAPDSTLVALDARNGSLRWQVAAGRRGHSSGAIVVKGRVISAGNCISGPRDACFISAHDAHTGALLWQFNTVQAPGDLPGGDSWGEVPLEQRLASPWGLPGSYDPQQDLIYWGIANPMPTSRAERHGVNAARVGTAAPTDLYSNSTVALNPDNGELVWYYQHLPGDDWDLDMNEERTLLRTRINPDPASVRWINPDITPGETRDVVVNVGEGGGLWMLDARTGEFLWATPFPFDNENFFLSDIDVDTGITHINEALLVDEPGERQLICYLNTRSFWPTSYSPVNNSLYVPYIRNCLDMTSADPQAGQPERRVGAPEPGVPEQEMNGVAKVNLETGLITHWPLGHIPTTSATLVTAGGLVFRGDIDRVYRALDAETGATLWQTRLGGPASMSNISYAVDGRQYIAIIGGSTLATQTVSSSMGPLPLQLDATDGNVAVYVFALPEPQTP